jgi:uncharacterized membrane protein
MLAFAMTLAIMSTIVEMMFAANFKAWREAAHRYKAVNMIISLSLSFIIGIAFGAGGLIAMTAGMISTVLSVPGYAFLHWNMDSPKATSLGTTRTNHTKAIAKHKYDKTKEVTNDLAKVAYGTAKVVTAPVWIPRKINHSYKNFKKARAT